VLGYPRLAEGAVVCITRRPALSRNRSVSDPESRETKSAPRAPSRRPRRTPAVVSGERELAFGAPPLPRAVQVESNLRALAQDSERQFGAAPARSALPGAAFFEESPDVILRFDRDGRVRYANPALERATALPRAAFVGRRLEEVDGFAPYAPLWAARIDELFATEESRWFKFAVAHPTGVKQFDVRLNAERDDAGQVHHATAVWRDVTVPRAMIRASREAGDFVDTMLSSVRIGVCMLDRGLRVRAWNEYLKQTLQVPAELAVGRRASEIPALAMPDAASAAEAFARMKSGEITVTQSFDAPFTEPSGPTRWLRVKRTPVFDPQGAFGGVFIEVERIDRERFAETSLAALRQALDSAGEMVFEIDRGGSIVDANETALAWLGYTRDELRGRLLAQVDVQLGPERFADILEQLSGRGAYQGESVYRTRLGSEFPVDVVLQRVEQGGREFIFLLARDLSDRKRIENYLADAAERFRTVFNESPVAKLLLDAQLRVVQANRAATQLLGREAQALTGIDLAALVGARHGDALVRLHERLAAGAASATEAELALACDPERDVWVRLTLRPWHAAGLAERQYLMVLEDLTDRRHAESQLQFALRDQQVLLETMSVGVAQAVQGRITLANREFARLFGFGDDEVIGMSLWELARDRHNRLPHEVSGLPAVRPHQTTSAEVVLFRSDGEPVWCLVQARPIQGAEAAASDDVMQAIYTFQDVSEMKRQREALSRSLLELNVVLDATAVAVMHLAGTDLVEGEVLRCNAQAYLMFGGNGVDVVGRRFVGLFSSESELARHRDLMRVPLAAGDVYSFEAQLRTRGDKLLWTLVSVRAVEAGAQALATGSAQSGLIVSILDISARRTQEEQLQALLAESQLLFDTALVGLLFVRDGRPMRANAAMEELLAAEPGGLTSQGQLFAHPTDQLLMANLAERFGQINDRGVVEFELHLYRRRGEPIWVAVQGRAVNAERHELGYVFAFVDIDERKRSERELLATLSELQLIFDNALVGMIYVSNDLIVKANAATERMFGYAPRDLRELSIDALFADGAEWRALAAAFAAATASADSAERSRGVSFERLAQRADGSTFWCAGIVRPLDPAQPAQGLILTLMDVDARHRSEDELRRVRNYLDLVVENLPVLVSVREAASGRFVSLNRAGESITGLAREQVIGRTWHEVYGRQFADLYAELDRKALSGGAQVDRPRDVMLRADGRRLTVNQRIVPLFESAAPGEDAAPAVPTARYVMSIIDDLTEEVRAEALLAETETRFRQFAENIDQLVFIATADLTAVLYVNPRYTALVGGPADELFDNPRHALKHVHFDDAPRLARALPRLVGAMRKLRKREITVRIDHPVRGVRTLNVRLNPVRLADGTVRVFGIADDVTERTAAEQQRIQDAVQQRDILVREVHHRIKNNLQGVAGLLQHMATSKPELAVHLNEIAGQIQAIAQVHGLQIRATGTLPILGVTQGIFTSLASMFGVEIRFEPPPPALWRWGLPEQEAVPLALVVNELGTNAIKYRTSRDAAIAVRLASKPDGIEIQVENPGKLKEGFDLARVTSSVSGLGLIKALLPRRGAKLAIEQNGSLVLTRLELSPPAIGEEV
jgi:PAS domain S-box-containing protein